MRIQRGPAVRICWAAFVFCGLLQAEMRVGAGKRVITPDLKKFSPVYIAGFGHNRIATGVHDDLFARCVAFDTGVTQPLVICGVDSIGLFSDDIERIRAEAARRAKRPLDVIVAALHDHQAPDTMGLWGPAPGKSGLNEDYNHLVVNETAEAILLAVQSLEPAKLSFASVKTPELDSFIADNRPPDVHDSELITIQARNRKNKTIATLVNWANHPETLASKNTLITADYPARLYSRLEELAGGTTVFINGAVGGMQSPLGAKFVDPATKKEIENNSFRKAEWIGQRLAEIAAGSLKKAKTAKIDQILFRELRVQIPVMNEGFRLAAKADLYHGRKPVDPEGNVNTPVGYLRFSAKLKPVLEAALIPGELYPELSVGGIVRYPGADYANVPFERPLKLQMTAPFRMLFGLAEDEIGYIIPRSEWDDRAPWLNNAPKRFYGEVNSVGPDAAPRIEAVFLRLMAANPITPIPKSR